MGLRLAGVTSRHVIAETYCTADSARVIGIQFKQGSKGELDFSSELEGPGALGRGKFSFSFYKINFHCVLCFWIFHSLHFGLWGYDVSNTFSQWIVFLFFKS